MLTSAWHKSTASDSGTGCVEVRRHGEHILVRDTKQRGRGPVLSFTPREWWAFKDGMVRGEFDLPEWHQSTMIKVASFPGKNHQHRVTPRDSA